MTQKKPCKHPYIYTEWSPSGVYDYVYCNVCEKKWSMRTVRRALLAYEKPRQSDRDDPCYCILRPGGGIMHHNPECPLHGTAKKRERKGK